MSERKVKREAWKKLFFFPKERRGSPEQEGRFLRPEERKGCALRRCLRKENPWGTRFLPEKRWYYPKKEKN